MSYNYYSFILNEKEHLFYTSRKLSSKEDILDHAIQFSFIEENDITKCNNIKELSLDEINKRREELYKKWWADREERRLSGEDVSYMLIPPAIGGVQLD